MALVTVLAMRALAASAPYEELVPRFDRKKSNAMVRKVANPTRANLDYAAYTANPVWYEKEKFRPQAPKEEVALSDITFGGLLSKTCNAIDKTPLTDQEKASPLAWEPLKKALWEVVKDPGFQSITGKVNGYKWNDPDIYKAYQQIVAAYLHGSGEDTEVWVRVEFKPWVKFVRDAATDENDDGYREVYGKLSLEEISPENRQKAFEWIRNEYTERVLTRQEVLDWITELASYWYPTKNTDILENDGVWPDDNTMRKVKRTMRGVTVKDPIAVVRGRPTGDIKKPVYNVYVVEGLKAAEAEGDEEEGESAAIENKMRDTTVSENFEANNRRFAKELEEHGGSYEKWAESAAKYVEAQKKILAGLPEEQMGLAGKDEWVFFRKSLEYSTGGDLADQPDDRNPLPHLKDLKAYLDKHEVNLLFVTIPVKSEVYFEKLPTDVAPSDKTAIVNPYSRKILKDIQDAGIEVIDVLPRYLEAKTKDGEHEEPVYQKQDTHWTDRGLQIVAKLIAERVEEYGWYEEAAADKVEYTVVDTTFDRQGDIVDKLPEEVKVNYPAVTLKARQVYRPDGKLNRRDKNGPIILMGDSFTGVFELVDCKGAGVASHIAAKTGLPVDQLTSWGGGPLVRSRFMRQRADKLGGKRLVVYLMVARDLYDYSQGWAPLEADK
jgi:alginate O-acetyltransferase complex protein AlgJ